MPEDKSLCKHSKGTLSLHYRTKQNNKVVPHLIDDDGNTSSEDKANIDVVAENAWAIEKEAGLIVDDENMVIRTLLEEFIEKKHRSHGNNKKNNRGRKRARARKSGVFNSSS